MAKLMYGLKSSEARRQYPRRFKMFLDFIGLEGTINEQARQLLVQTKDSPSITDERFMEFVEFQLERSRRGEIAESTISNYYKATKLFCEMNDISTVNWKKIRRGIPRGRQASNDRAPTIEEIQKLTDYPDRRIKPIVYTMLSSGVRLGAWDYLQWRNVKLLMNEKGEVIAAKLTVYAGDAEEYFSFITPEAYNALKEWMDFRASYGERITGESWLMGDIWQTTNMDYGAKLGLATFPKRLKSTGVKRLLERALWEQGVRQPLQKGAKRHEWKAAHGFRKAYKSRAEQVMKPINVEITMGHNIGISASYYKPTENDVLQDYLRAVDVLTVSSDKTVLRKQLQELTEQGRSNEYIIKAKLQEKDDTVRAMKEKYDADIELLKNAISDMQQLLKNPRKLAQIS
jgi:integrase